jgi:hypothetical protein
MVIDFDVVTSSAKTVYKNSGSTTRAVDITPQTGQPMEGETFTIEHATATDGDVVRCAVELENFELNPA